MEQIEILKNLVKEAKNGDEFGVKPDLTPSEIQAIEWLIGQVKALESDKRMLENSLVSIGATSIEKRLDSEREWFKNQSELIEEIAGLKSNELNNKDYIESLESLLIFMCQTYEQTRKVLMDLFKFEQNEAYLKIPIIQGTHNDIPISQLSKMTFQEPKYGFMEVRDKVEKNRKECPKCGNKYINKDFGLCESCCETHFEKLG